MATKVTKTDVRFRCTNVVTCACGKSRVCRAVEHVTVKSTLPTTKAGWASLLEQAGPGAVAMIKALLS